jgi:DNA-binding MarR family transcriptional regulator
MRDERRELIRQVLDLQSDLDRSRCLADEWLAVDLTMPQAKTLVLLYSDGGAPMGQLARSLGVTLPTVTGIVDRLVDHGLAHRLVQPRDRRLVVCRLTRRGSETVERLHQAGRGRMANLLDDLSVDDLRTVLAGLAVLAAAAAQSADEAVASKSTTACCQATIGAAS